MHQPQSVTCRHQTTISYLSSLRRGCPHDSNQLTSTWWHSRDNFLDCILFLHLYFRPYLSHHKAQQRLELLRHSTTRDFASQPATMADQVMADRDSPELKTEAPDHELHESQAVHTRSRHQDRFIHNPYETRRKPRNHGLKALNKLTKALARSNLADDKRGARETRQARKNKVPRDVAAELAQVYGEKIPYESRKTRSMTGKLPLGFDNMYLSNMGTPDAFMNNNQIRSWVESVYDPHLKEWYQKCLSAPEKQPDLEAAQKHPLALAKAILKEVTDQHDSSKLLQPLLGEADECPTAFHMDLSQRNSLTFVQHAAMVTCFVVRDGQRGGQFAACTDEHDLHRAAVMLLISVIMDLEKKSGYFSRLLVDVEETTAPESTWNSVAKPHKVKKRSHSVKFPSRLSDSVAKALHYWKQGMDCYFTFDKSAASKKVHVVHLVGSERQVTDMAQTVRKLVENSKA